MKRAALIVLLVVAAAACTGTDVRLDVPPLGTGFQLGTPRFSVPEGTEVEACYYLQVPPAPAGEAFWSIHAIELGMNIGSHDMSLYAASDAWAMANVTLPNDATLAHPCTATDFALGTDMSLVYRDVRSKSSPTTWTLPEGVAFQLRARQWVVLRTHYANTTTQPTPVAGRVVINLEQLDSPTPSTPLACAMFIDDRALAVPVGESLATKSCTLPAAAQIVGVMAHTGSRGTNVTVSAPLGAELYSSTAWDDPPFITWSDAATAPMVPAGTVVQLACSYLNLGTTALTYGPLDETNEHCDAVVYFYPCVPGGGVYCL